MRLLRALAAALLFAAFAATGAAALDFPRLSGRVVDEAGILTEPTQAKLTALLAEHERQTGNQVVVVTLKDLRGLTIEQYGYQLGRAWGIGPKQGNKGALLIVAPNSRETRIEVGYGLEGTLTDLQSSLIIQNVMLPAFRKGDYDSGVTNGTVTILKALGGKPSAAVPENWQDSAAPDEDGGGFHIPVFLIVIVLWIVFGRFFWPLFFLGGLGRGGWGGGGWGGGGGGWSGGGGFSGGGGSFGGGGASGRW